MDQRQKHKKRSTRERTRQFHLEWEIKQLKEAYVEQYQIDPEQIQVFVTEHGTIEPVIRPARKGVHPGW